MSDTVTLYPTSYKLITSSSVTTPSDYADLYASDGNVLLMHFGSHSALVGKFVQYFDLYATGQKLNDSNGYAEAAIECLKTPTFENVAAPPESSTWLIREGTPSTVRFFPDKQQRHGSFGAESAITTGEVGACAVENGIGLFARDQGHTYDTGNPIRIYLTGNDRPYIVVTYRDTEHQPSNPAPSAGYVNPRNALTFTWDPDYERTVDAGASCTKGTFYWRYTSSGSWNTLTPDTVSSITVPANTFQPGKATLYWKASVLFDGVEKQTDVCTLTTADTTCSARILSPTNGYINRSVAWSVMWQHITSSGSDPTGYDLQQSADGTTWSNLLTDHATDATSCTVPADTVAAGTLYLRVRTYNADGAAGEWSDPVAVTVIGAPDAPAVRIDRGGPRPLIRWSAADQQSWEAAIDGAGVGSDFGSGTVFEPDVYLTDGTHTIAVRVCNQYGIWSAWGTVSLTVANVPGPALSLLSPETVSDAAQLSWSAGDYDKFYVYRDGELIAKVTGTFYTDRLTAGEHTYQVRGAYDDSGNYGLSAELRLTVRPACVELIDVETGDTLALIHADTQNRVTRISHMRQFASTHYAGASLPSVEITEWLDRTMSVSGASADRTLRGRLLAMTGRLVCLRDTYCNSVIGVCPGWSVRSQQFYDSYETTVTDANWREALHHDPIA